MFYRLRQFWQTIHPIITQDELAWAVSLLPPHGLPLFQAQPLAEQRHALAVARDLWNSGVRDSPLLIAALLHDCGKTKYPPQVWERIAIVLLQKAPPQIRDALSRSRLPGTSCLRTAAEHPVWGAEMAAQTGLDTQIVELIREHHAPRTAKGYLLHQADNRH